MTETGGQQPADHPELNPEVCGGGEANAKDGAAENTAPEDVKSEAKGAAKKEKKRSKEDALRNELDSANERLLRVMAEYDNYRKRTDREKLQSAANGRAHALEKLLPVLDTLEMAAAANTADVDYKKGVEMTAGLFRSALVSLGVSEVGNPGDRFDPNIHNCIASEPSSEWGSGAVTKVMQKGYMMGDRVLRPAAVAVSE